MYHKIFELTIEKNIYYKILKCKKSVYYIIYNILIFLKNYFACDEEKIEENTIDILLILHKILFV